MKDHPNDFLESLTQDIENAVVKARHLYQHAQQLIDQYTSKTDSPLAAVEFLERIVIHNTAMLKALAIELNAWCVKHKASASQSLISRTHSLQGLLQEALHLYENINQLTHSFAMA